MATKTGDESTICCDSCVSMGMHLEPRSHDSISTFQYNELYKLDNLNFDIGHRTSPSMQQRFQNAEWNRTHLSSPSLLTTFALFQ